MGIFIHFGDDEPEDSEDKPLLGRNWKDEPLPFTPTRPTLKEQLDALTDEERIELFSDYCKYCGSKEKPCFCWNDE